MDGKQLGLREVDEGVEVCEGRGGSVRAHVVLSVGRCLERVGVQGTCPCRVAAFTGAPCHRGSADAAAPT